MKKIINGKRYDTDTAKKIAFWSNGGGWRDFNHIEETLYKKSTGEFFLFGEGGANTRYSVSEGSNTWTGGSRIMPLSYKDAQEWAEKHLDGDEYEKIFGEIEENDENTSVHLSMRASDYERLKRAASEKGMNLSEYIVSSLLSE